MAPQCSTYTLLLELPTKETLFIPPLLLSLLPLSPLAYRNVCTYAMLACTFNTHTHACVEEEGKMLATDQRQAKSLRNWHSRQGPGRRGRTHPGTCHVAASQDCSHFSLSLTTNNVFLMQLYFRPSLPPLPPHPLSFMCTSEAPLYRTITIISKVFVLINLQTLLLYSFARRNIHGTICLTPSLPLLPLSRLCRSSANWIPTAASYTFAGIAGAFCLHSTSPLHTYLPDTLCTVC